MILNAYLLLSVLLLMWCFLHSALISNQFISFAKPILGKRFRYYRIGYNVFSLLSFLPLVWYSASIKGEWVFNWDGYFLILRASILLLSFCLLLSGSKTYDLLSFAGFRQIQNSEHHKSLSSNGNINSLGILSMVRHPWYTATFLIIWARNMDTATVIVNVILSIYLIIGCYLEEKKLVLEFGDEYRTYQEEVSMLFPWKWLKIKLRG